MTETFPWHEFGVGKFHPVLSPGESLQNKRPAQLSSDWPLIRMAEVWVDYAFFWRLMLHTPIAAKPEPRNNSEAGSGTGTWEIVWLMAEIETCPPAEATR